jgi:hypothetical protein
MARRFRSIHPRFQNTALVSLSAWERPTRLRLFRSPNDGGTNFSTSLTVTPVNPGSSAKPRGSAPMLNAGNDVSESA